ncbi:hypothetical protein [Lacrimispora xylanolytica]|uniref:BlaR1 peptidase M56 n=1 Tax=Lacrimispora xylanolytica TaxID=29375 RepID=A0ABY7AH49_9FIRM|nr:hypothetical protein [Lacrimispora xylanolytica]WAJ26092.1 hypothetical protein OW255_15145 [Lacrimispora xylanolytica]
MVNIENAFTNVGWILIPFSFVSYFLLGLIAYKWKVRYKAKLVKAIWYILNIVLSVTHDVTTENIAVMILCFESYEAILEFF